MKTTLNIDDTVMAELKREAARQGRTKSELVETALRLLLRSQRKHQPIPALPKFHSGGARVDIADRDALDQAMEGRQSPMSWYMPPTPTLMREHEIGRIGTRDTDFNQFPFLEVIDPLR